MPKHFLTGIMGKPTAMKAYEQERRRLEQLHDKMMAKPKQPTRSQRAIPTTTPSKVWSEVRNLAYFIRQADVKKLNK